ncbi:DUF2057 domain-containing protein [Agitococcus lubricus]|uniref:Uncharacterized protein YccT (UPF0319 family) n=1 Tax=Agitococcus lubricus TaxID=1077255 RepID=A0A2T5IZ55_9GAMM|nr:DUF2057 domain-containing protein [Agitococcus lubricus]PTQ89299.1 uncharacterized protein YccT (UPF0319 family) [Agitococcus lubricus]
MSNPLLNILILTSQLLGVANFVYGADTPPLSVSSKATLDVPDMIQVLSIDGQEQSSFFGTRAMKLSLDAGEHVISVRYNQLFQLGSDDHDIVKSKPMVLRFTAQANGQYQLITTPPKRYDAAKEFAKQPDIKLIDKVSGTSQHAILIKSYAEASLVDSIGKAFQGENDSPTTSASNSSANLQLLQDIWQRASAAERQAFAAWLAAQASK